MKPASPTRLLFIRHAQTTWYAQERYAGDSEVPLSENAAEQISCLNGRLAHEHFDVIYSSPLSRCLETILPCAVKQHRRIIKRSELRERYLGDWEGHNAKEIHRNHGGYHYPRSAYDGTFRIPHAEPLDEIETRLRHVLHDIVDSHPGQSVAISTHGGIMWMLQARVVLNPPEELHWPRNCCVITVTAENGHFLLEKIEEIDDYTPAHRQSVVH